MREYQLDKKEKVWKVKNADMAFLRKKKKRTTLQKKNPLYQSNNLRAHIMHSPIQHRCFAHQKLESCMVFHQKGML